VPFGCRLRKEPMHGWGKKKNDEKECKWKDDFGYSHGINKLF